MEMQAAQAGEAVAGDDAQFGRQRLEQHRQDVGQHDDPEQQIAELRAALDVGGEIAGVDIGDRGDDGGARERQEAAHAAPPAGQRFARRAPRAVGQPVVNQRLRHAPSTIE
jgi:hypothetical protein